MRRLVPACAGLLAFACLATAAFAQPNLVQKRQARGEHAAALGRALRTYQQQTWRWDAVMGRPPAPTAGRVLADLGTHDLRQALEMWRLRARSARVAAQHPPHMRQFLCIHHYEGSWTDPGAPYYGGLQMSLTFQSHYGWSLLRRKGTADHWSPLEQIWVAERALRSGSGYWPWPNTARFCGLI